MPSNCSKFKLRVEFVVGIVRTTYSDPQTSRVNSYTSKWSPCVYAVANRVVNGFGFVVSI